MPARCSETELQKKGTRVTKLLLVLLSFIILLESGVDLIQKKKLYKGILKICNITTTFYRRVYIIFLQMQSYCTVTCLLSFEPKSAPQAPLQV